LIYSIAILKGKKKGTMNREQRIPNPLFPEPNLPLILNIFRNSLI